MTALEVAFVFGLVIGLLIGLWISGRLLLSRMHHDDIQKAHKEYERRKETYL